MKYIILSIITIFVGSIINIFIEINLIILKLTALSIIIIPSYITLRKAIKEVGFRL
jgi:hypothetical protein